MVCRALCKQQCPRLRLILDLPGTLKFDSGHLGPYSWCVEGLMKRGIAKTTRRFEQKDRKPKFMGTGNGVMLGLGFRDVGFRV